MSYDPEELGGAWAWRGQEAAREKAARERQLQGECMTAAEMQAMLHPNVIERGPLPLELRPSPPMRSRLSMLPGNAEVYFAFTAPPPNAWRRFWTWFLLGWVWTKVE